MVKVSITLPNAAQITLESEESEVIQQVVSMALRDLPRELMQSSAGSDSGKGQAEVPQVRSRVTNRPNSKVVEEATVGIVERTGLSAETGGPNTPAASASGLASGAAAATPGQTRTRRSGAPSPAQPRRDSAPRDPGTSGTSGTRSAATASQRHFAHFCAAAAPLGDMRKVVVAAEGAKRFLEMPSVDAPDLAGLFDLAGWRIPHNFIQTLRNAARDKYRWLERVPGRSGRYSATELGRTVTMTQ